MQALALQISLQRALSSTCSRRDIKNYRSIIVKSIAKFKFHYRFVPNDRNAIHEWCIGRIIVDLFFGVFFVDPRISRQNACWKQKQHKISQGGETYFRAATLTYFWVIFSRPTNFSTKRVQETKATKNKSRTQDPRLIFGCFFLDQQISRQNVCWKLKQQKIIQGS